jgi:toxin HigB-1
MEARRGDRKGQHSIRINNEWQTCFMWRGGHGFEVEIVDYR